MNQYLLYHRHSARDCAASFAAWNGYQSPLRKAPALSTCNFDAHEIWWSVTAGDERAALANLPRFVAVNTVVVKVATVDVP